jgi:hypothetical protein
MLKRKFSEIKNNNIFVCPSDIKNYIMKDPLIDYLHLYYKNEFSKFFPNNQEFCKSEFEIFIKQKGIEYEKNIMDSFPCEFTKVNGPVSKKSFSETLKLLKLKVPVIYQGVLYNDTNNTYGCPDLIIRGDYLNKYYNKNEDINSYYIIDIKFSTIYLSSDESYILNSGLLPYYKSQLLLYTIAINNILKQNISKAYILGKRTVSSSKGIKIINTTNNILSAVNYNKQDNIYYKKLNDAIEWIIKLKTEGSKWKLLPKPSVHELYPNMTNKYNIKWLNIKKYISNELKDLTNIIYVGPKERDHAFSKNIYSYDDRNCNSKTLNLNGKKGEIVDNILKINSKQTNYIILPNKIKSNHWRNIKRNQFEFYIDYETTSNFSDEPFIFMIGVGYVLNNLWIFKTFILDTELDAHKILFKNFWEYIKNILIINKKKEAIFIHWTPAEPSTYNNIKEKLNIQDKHFMDLYKVFIQDNIVIKGAYNYSLKTIARAMFNNNLIKTCWKDDTKCNNGLDALLLAHNIYFDNKKSSINKEDFNDIIYYNEIDCKVLYEIINYLRINH